MCRCVWTLDGPRDRADYAYRLTSPQVAFDRTGFIDVRAEGRGKLTPWPMRVPLLLKARAITGVGDVAGGILANLSLEGMLSVTPQLVRGEKLKLTSARLNGTMSLLIDLTQRAVRHRHLRRDEALPDPGHRDRRCRNPAAGRARTGRQGIARGRQGAGLGAAARQ